jgi:hypothetical protein
MSAFMNKKEDKSVMVSYKVVLSFLFKQYYGTAVQKYTSMGNTNEFNV